MNVVELFSGSGTFSKIFKENGHDTFTIDIRKRKGKCEPDLRKDIMDVLIRDIPFKKVHVLWASPPCDVFSKAGGNFHWNSDGTPKTEKCDIHLRLLQKTLRLIEKIRPDVFFIENPDGKMKYRKELVNFLIRNNGMMKRIYYSDYSFGTMKPTILFTNALDYKPTAHENKPGSFELNSEQENKSNVNVRAKFDNMTKDQKQTIPHLVAREILEYCEKSRA